MTNVRVIGTRFGLARRAIVSSPGSAVLDTTASPLGATVAQVDGLKRALESLRRIADLESALRVDDVGAGVAILCRFRAPHAARVPTTTRLCF